MEEKVLVHYKMEWTVRYFLYMCKTWKTNSMGKNVSHGAKAYASRQSAIWMGCAVEAEKDFKLINLSYVSLIM